MHAWLYSVKIAENCMYIKEEKKMEKHAHIAVVDRCG